LKIPLAKIVKNIQGTKVLADKISYIIEPGDIVVVNGNLGSGKTTLIQYICLNYKIYNVSSPTFSIVNEYTGTHKVFHFDFYRLKKIDELYDLGFEDYLNDSEAIIFIEWGNLIYEIIPNPYYEIHIKHFSSNNREIKINRNV
jgi:tRNA threonylcarbamoyladenosine biosynthesis protein TsaE